MSWSFFRHGRQAGRLRPTAPALRHRRARAARAVYETVLGRRKRRQGSRRDQDEDVDSVARELIAAAGHGERFGHGLAGVGIEVRGAASLAALRGRARRPRSERSSPASTRELACGSRTCGRHRDSYRNQPGPAKQMQLVGGSDAARRRAIPAARVDPDHLALSMERRCATTPDSRRADLPPARGGVALDSRLGLRHLHLDRAADLHVAGPLVDEEDVDSALGSSHCISVAGEAFRGISSARISRVSMKTAASPSQRYCILRDSVRTGRNSAGAKVLSCTEPSSIRRSLVRTRPALARPGVLELDDRKILPSISMCEPLRNCWC